MTADFHRHLEEHVRHSKRPTRRRLSICARIGLLKLLFVAPWLSACSDRAVQGEKLASWSIAATPVLEIRDDDPSGEVVLGIAEHVTRLPEGGVLVTDRGLYSLRLFGADGRLIRAIGRQGSGPNEFEYIRAVNRCGDSLFVEDIVLRRVTVHALDGTIARTMTTTAFGGGTDAYRSACNADGVFVHHAWNRFDPTKAGRHRVPVAVWLTSSASASRTTLDDVGGEEFVAFGDGAGLALLRKRPHLGVGRRLVYVGAADSGVVRVYTLDGMPAGVRRLPDADLRATPADLERAKRLDSLGQNAERQERTRGAWELDTPPSTLPPYDALIVDSDDNLWVRRHPVAGDDATPWIVFDPDGAHVATVLLPAVLSVHEIGRDYIAGIVHDPETAIHAIRVLALNRKSAR